MPHSQQPETSLAAYDAKVPKLRESHIHILNTVRNRMQGREGNAKQISNATVNPHYDEVEVNRRLSELRTMNMMYRTDRKAPSGSGNPSFIHALTEDLAPAQPEPAHHPAFQPFPTGEQGDLFNDQQQAA